MYFCFCLERNVNASVSSVYIFKPCKLFPELVARRFYSKFTGKHLCWSLLFKKVADFQPATLLNKRLRRRCFLSKSKYNFSPSTTPVLLLCSIFNLLFVFILCNFLYFLFVISFFIIIIIISIRNF